MPEKEGYPKGKENHKMQSYKVKGGKKKTEANKGYAGKETSNKAGFKMFKRSKH